MRSLLADRPDIDVAVLAPTRWRFQDVGAAILGRPPLALSHLRPNRPNRAFEVVRPKIGGLANCRERPRQRKTKGPRKLQDPSVDREIPNPLAHA